MPSFGTENLQLVSSNKDLINNIPDVAYDNEIELYFVQTKTAKNAVIKTRALKPKKNKAVKAAEATLTFTTMAN